MDRGSLSDVDRGETVTAVLTDGREFLVKIGIYQDNSRPPADATSEWEPTELWLARIMDGPGSEDRGPAAEIKYRVEEEKATLSAYAPDDEIMALLGEVASIET